MTLMRAVLVASVCVCVCVCVCVSEAPPPTPASGFKRKWEEKLTVHRENFQGNGRNKNITSWEVYWKFLTVVRLEA